MAVSFLEYVLCTLKSTKNKEILLIIGKWNIFPFVPQPGNIIPAHKIFNQNLSIMGRKRRCVFVRIFTIAF